MASERASIFEGDDLDLSDFRATTSTADRPDVDAIRDIALERGFVSRDPDATLPAPTDGLEDGRILRRRYTTGRNRQLNLRVTISALRRFYALADQKGWVLGEAFEHAVAALERHLKSNE